jgi:hypothetical protein
MIERNDYPDLDPDGLGDLHSIERIPSMRNIAPNISWGDDYKSWPIEKRLRFAERLASTMNHAADELQKDRARIIELAEAKELSLTAANEELSRLRTVVNGELGEANAREQRLAAELIKAQKEAKAHKREVERLQEMYGPLD